MKPTESGFESSSWQDELLALMAQHSQRALPISSVAAALLALLLSLEVEWYWPLSWMLMVCLSNFIHTKQITRVANDRSADADRRLRRASFDYVWPCAAWASIMIFFPWVSTSVGALLSIFVVSVATAALNSTVGYRNAYLPSLIVLLLPVGLAWAIYSSGEVQILERLIFIAAAALFVVTMMQYAQGAHALFRESYDIRHQRLELLQKLDGALRQTESANQAKTRFLASASHDLRQPIHALGLFSGALQREALSPRGIMLAEQIDKSIRNLAIELDGLLDISKLDAGVVRPASIVFDARRVLEELYAETLGQASDKGLTLTVDLPSSLPVRSDPALLNRILRNLLSNAVKYTEYGGITIRGRLTESRVCLDVVDSGLGVPDDERERIFEEFYQLNNPERERSKGLGLGLSIVRRLTDLLNIELKMASVPGSGTTFSLVMDRAEAGAVPGSKESKGYANQLDSLRVLVVDDEEAIRLAVTALLEGEGFEVVSASSTVEALRAIQTFEPDVVLADLRLRGEDNGISTVEKLRECFPRLPALLVSGDTDPERLAMSDRAGIELLPKPIAPADLISAINRSVSGRGPKA